LKRHPSLVRTARLPIRISLQLCCVQIMLLKCMFASQVLSVRCTHALFRRLQNAARGE
jgi:hypothetical protein